MSGESPTSVREADAAPHVSGNTLIVEDLQTYFFTKGGVVKAVNGVSFGVDKGEVLGLVARGLTNQGIADELHLSPHTVARHLANIFTKLGVRSRTAASSMAVAAGIANAEHGQI